MHVTLAQLLAGVQLLTHVLGSYLRCFVEPWPKYLTDIGLQHFLSLTFVINNCRASLILKICCASYEYWVYSSICECVFSVKKVISDSRRMQKNILL